MTVMDKAYLIWAGIYEDKYVVAVCATRELAEQWLKMMQDVRDENGREVYAFSSPGIEEIDLVKNAADFRRVWLAAHPDWKFDGRGQGADQF